MYHNQRHFNDNNNGLDFYSAFQGSQSIFTLLTLPRQSLDSRDLVHLVAYRTTTRKTWVQFPVEVVFGVFLEDFQIGGGGLTQCQNIIYNINLNIWKPFTAGSYREVTCMK